MNEKTSKIILELVKVKSQELSTWKQVQWVGGRVHVEINNLEYEIRDFSIDVKMLYIQELLKTSFIVQDNLPLTAPVVTEEFRGELKRLLAKIQLEQIDKVTHFKRKKRPAIPFKMRSLLQKEVNSKCPFCNNGDVGHFQIHHIDENPENNDFKNLLMLCPNCHSKITKGDILFQTVLDTKENLK